MEPKDDCDEARLTISKQPADRYRNHAQVRDWSAPDAWSSTWWVPSDLLHRVDEESLPFDGDAFFNAPNLKPLREAHAAARFTRAAGGDCCTRVRLDRGQFPDFHVRLGASEFYFELVEADRPERQRGREYAEIARRVASGETDNPAYYNPRAERRDVPDAVRRALIKKASKHYAAPPHLLVYVNFGNMGGPALTRVQAIGLAKAWATNFKSIWLLCGEQAICCTPQSLPTVTTS
jgi:hypothetical protein